VSTFLSNYFLSDQITTQSAQLDLDLPVIAVIGSQSAGKSSLIESISGIKLPRASGTCTRLDFNWIPITLSDCLYF
jgi:ABC-type phosphate/phosphonate transport system ATPase subunit